MIDITIGNDRDGVYLKPHSEQADRWLAAEIDTYGDVDLTGEQMERIADIAYMLGFIVRDLRERH